MSCNNANGDGKENPGRQATQLQDHHFLDHTPAKSGAKRSHPYRECIACNYKKSRRHTNKRKQTSFWCPECNVAICVPKYVHAYHTLHNYRTNLLPGGANPSSDSE